MTREGTIALEPIDANCNTCAYFVRDVDWAEQQRNRYGIKKLDYSKGRCKIKGIELTTPNGVCCPHNQPCWQSRRNTEHQWH